VRFLEGLYKALGLPQDEVYSRLHSGEVASKPASKTALPSNQGLDRQTAGAEIDHEKLARLKEETSAVSSMLASIFKEDETPAKPADNKPAVQVEFAGLDSAHSSLLVRLTEAPMESDAFEVICRDHKLLPSGAIETINDWAFDALDDYAIEEGELMCIQEHLIEQIKAMRKVK
jgi:TerB-C domain